MPASETDRRRRDALINQLRAVDGWLRDAQAETLWASAVRLDETSTVVEIGSFHGKSTIVLATAAAPGVRIFAIDPHAGNDRDPGQWVGTGADGVYDHAQFLENLNEHGVIHRITQVREFSHDALDHVAGPVHLLYVDGAHGYSAALADLTDWGGRVPNGGRMIIHDVYNSFFVSLAVVRRLWFSRRWRKVDRTTSMACYERCQLSGTAYLSSVVANVTELPHFVRNMIIKVLRAAGAERVAIVLGHRPGERLY